MVGKLNSFWTKISLLPPIEYFYGTSGICWSPYHFRISKDLINWLIVLKSWTIFVYSQLIIVLRSFKIWNGSKKIKGITSPSHETQEDGHCYAAKCQTICGQMGGKPQRIKIHKDIGYNDLIECKLDQRKYFRKTFCFSPMSVFFWQSRRRADLFNLLASISLMTQAQLSINNNNDNVIIRPWGPRPILWYPITRYPLICPFLISYSLFTTFLYI